MTARILISIVALLHAGFLVLEMALWTKPAGLKIFHMSLERAELTAVLAANQGLYNGFLAAGLIWALLYPDPLVSKQIASFFLICIIIAGIYGAVSADKICFFLQSLPAIAALAALYML